MRVDCITESLGLECYWGGPHGRSLVVPHSISLFFLLIVY